MAGSPSRVARTAVERNWLFQLPRICPAAASHLDRYALRGLSGGTVAGLSSHQRGPPGLGKLAGCHQREPADGLTAEPAATPIFTGKLPGLVRAVPRRYSRDLPALWRREMNPTSFPGKLALQQRVLPDYRAPFFDALAQACQGGLTVCAGLPRPQESIAVTDQLHNAEFVPVQNLHLLKGSFYLCYQKGLLAWLEDCSPQALIVEANPRYLSTPVAIRWMKRRGKPVLGWGLGAQPPSNSSHFLQKWEERQKGAMRLAFLRPFEALITYSRRGAQEYERLGFPAEKIFVAPNAAAPRPSLPMPTRPAEFSGHPVVLFVGRLQARKRVDLLLQACAALPDALKPRLVIVGAGPERKILEGLAQKVYPAAQFPGAKHGEE